MVDWWVPTKFTTSKVKFFARKLAQLPKEMGRGTISKGDGQVDGASR